MNWVRDNACGDFVLGVTKSKELKVIRRKLEYLVHRKLEDIWVNTMH